MSTPTDGTATATTTRLRVAAFEPRSLANGPGVRAVLWVQGCGRRCPGCFNQDFLSREGGREVSVDEVVTWIAAAGQSGSGPIEGVTFSGGAPFAQAAPLAQVAGTARTQGRGVLVFTGHPWEDLEMSSDTGWRALLAATDLIVAGAYERERPGTHPLLSSANQRLVFLTDRYRHHDFGRRRRLEFRIAADGTVRASGLRILPVHAKVTRFNA